MLARIATRPVVTKLSLSHHKLSDEGIVTLLGGLSSLERGKYYEQVTEIDLGNNSCGDKGLEAISDYLFDNKKLKKLLLQRVCALYQSVRGYY